MIKANVSFTAAARRAFSLLEVIIAITVFVIVLTAVMEALWSSNSLRKQTESIIKIKQDARSVLEFIVDGVAKGKVIEVNMDEPVQDPITLNWSHNDYTEYSYIEWTPYSHDPVTDEIIFSGNQEMSYSTMKQMFPELSDDYRGDLSMLPAQVRAGVNLDTDSFKGFWAVLDEDNGIVYLGMTLLSEENGSEVIANYNEQIVLRQDINQE